MDEWKPLVTGAIGVAGGGGGGVPVTNNGAGAGAAGGGGGGGGGGGLRESDVRQAATIQDDIEALISEQELFAVLETIKRGERLAGGVLRTNTRPTLNLHLLLRACEQSP